jgi:DNA-binding FadR family transcriptional regulator
MARSKRGVRAGRQATSERRPAPVANAARLRTLAADPVFDALAGAILRGKYSPGSALPPERELGALFNVSRLIVRQALHRLREMGLVSGGQGGQNTVLDPDSANDPRIVALTMELAPEKADEHDVVERQLLGGLILLELAERRISEDEITSLDEMLRAAEARDSATEHDIGEFETLFWTTVARASGNKILVREARWWFEMLDRQPGRARWFYDRPELRLAVYRAIVDNLRNHHGNAALRFLEVVRPVLAARPRAPSGLPSAAAAAGDGIDSDDDPEEGHDAGADESGEIAGTTESLHTESESVLSASEPPP